MKTYYARMLDADTGGEGGYQFLGPDDLMSQTADEVISVFFREVETKILKHHVDWEVVGALNNKERRVVTAIGSLIPKEDEPTLPFLLLISDRNNGPGLRSPHW